MNGLVIVLFAAVFVCSSANAGSYYPYYRPYGALRNYIPPVAPVAPVAPLTSIPAAAAPLTAAGVPSLLSDYYTYAAAAASLGAYNPYGAYPYSGYPYLGSYTGYPLLKK